MRCSRKMLSVAVLLLCLFLIAPAQAATLTDLPSGNLYTPYILSFFEGHIITGDMRTGKEDRKFRPLDPISRSEMAKLTALIRLIEKYGNTENWSEFSELAFVDTTENKLKPYYKCTASSCSSIGGVPFSDVKEKDPNCFEKNIATGGSCEPWYTQYVYYAVSYGYIKGYESKSGGARYFAPDDSILRIHALKMAIAENGNTELSKDPRYTRLNAEARSRRAFAPVCLRGAETYILKNNGNDKKLLAYALLADRLDLFGKNCEVFGKAEGPQARADFLQKPVTRQEAPRYLSMTTTYSAVAVDPDPTVATEEENKELGKDDETYVSPLGPDEVIDPKTLIDFNRKRTEIPAEPPAEPIIKKPKIPVAPKVELPDETLPAKIFQILPASTRLCGPFGCTTLKAKAEVEILSAQANPYIPGEYVQNVSYDGQLYTVDCEVIKSDECLIAGWKPKPTVISVTPSLITAIGKECKGSKQVCDLLKQTLTGKSLNPDLFADCTTDACRAKKITDTFVPLLTFLNIFTTLDSKKVLTYLSPYFPETPTIAAVTPKPPVESVVPVVEPEEKKGAETDYWYTVIPGWYTKNDGLWGGVFTEKKYDKDHLSGTLFSKKEGDKYKELIVKVVGQAEDYDASDPSADANKKAMIQNYRTDRWYFIKYTDPAKPNDGEKSGWVPVSGTIWKNENLFYMVKNGYYIFTYYSLARYNVGYWNSDSSKINKLNLHNTNGPQIAFWISSGHPTPPVYFLAGEHKDDISFPNKLIAYLPEYRSGGSIGKGGFSGQDIETQSISVEIANVEWANPSKETANNKDREVVNGKFNTFDFNTLKGNYDPNNAAKKAHYAVIQGDDYDLVNYYFNQKDGFFEALNITDINSLTDFGKKMRGWIIDDGKKENCASKKCIFDKFYKQKNNKYILWSIDEEGFDPKKNIAAQEIIESGSDPDHVFADLYLVLNTIPFDYDFPWGNSGAKLDFRLVSDARGTFPLMTWNLPGHKRAEDMNDGMSSDYFQRYTKGQYDTLEMFIAHINGKYGIPKATFTYDFTKEEVAIPNKYGFYYQRNNIDGDGGVFITSVKNFEGTISHQNQTNYGKMCPAPGFQIDRIPSLNQ